MYLISDEILDWIDFLLVLREHDVWTTIHKVRRVRFAYKKLLPFYQLFRYSRTMFVFIRVIISLTIETRNQSLLWKLFDLMNET